MIVTRPWSFRPLVVASCVAAGVFAQAQVTGFSGFAATNGSAKLLAADTLQLTDGIADTVGGAEHQAGSAFYGVQVDVVHGWTATFHYVAVTDPSNLPADGITFVIQNDTRNTSALGDGGGGLGYGNVNNDGLGITPSAAFALNIWDNFGQSPRGTELLSTGAIDRNYTPLGNGIDLTSAVGVDVTLTYGNGLLSEHFQQGALSWDSPTQQAFVLSGVAIGGKAYIGFTGGDGYGLSDQRISGFRFAPVPEPFTMGLGIAGICLAVRRRLKAK